MRKPYDPKHLYERCRYRGNLMSPSNCSNGTWACETDEYKRQTTDFTNIIFVCENCYNKYKQKNNLKWS